jgi:ABC-type amino acid transport substrate-binding protein
MLQFTARRRRPENSCVQQPALLWIAAYGMKKFGGEIMKKKLLSLLLAAACVFSMAACGSGSDSAGDSGNAAQTSEADDTEDAEEAEASGEGGTLIMATNAEFPPYEYHEGDEIVGIDAEIAAAIAEELGMELKIEDMAFDSIITAVSGGKADMGLAGMTVNPDREKNVNFSDTYATAAQVIIVKEGSETAGPDDLIGKKIGVQLGTTGDIYAEDIEDAEIERYNKGMEAVQALLQDKIDAVVIDGEPAKVYVAENEGLKVLDEPLTEEEYAIAIAKDNDELLEKVNTALTSLKDSGKLDEIVAKYISADE